MITVTDEEMAQAAEALEQMAVGLDRRAPHKRLPAVAAQLRAMAERLREASNADN